MTQGTQAVESHAIREQIKTLDHQSRELTNRRDQLDRDMDRLQSELGKAMALDDSPAVEEAKQALRSAEDEREGAERGLAYLTTERERLQAELRVARIEEAVAEREARIAEAVTAVDELAESLADYLKTFVPLAEHAASLTTVANEAEREAANRAGERVPSTARAHSEGWARYLGLETVTAALRRYAGD